MEISRRDVMAGTAAALAAGARAAAPLTAADVIARIKAHVGIPWMDKTVDGIVAGDASTPVTGIATTMMATFDALKAAAAARKNLIVTHEPTFWSHQENVTEVQNDPLYLEKLDFIERNKLISFHFHDHWHGLQPVDGIHMGMTHKLGWEAYADPAQPARFDLPPTTLLNLARHLRKRLNARTMRVVGKPAMPVKRVVASWGYAMKAGGLPLINSDADVFIVGETWEWELVEYVQDLVSAGRNKALIILGHIESEQYGMKYCADWLRGFVPEVPVQFISLPEPYWGVPPEA
jgi:putative NIF3 family GTP cyclohydrolase 1 type 2